jgi:hypothetical protein
MQSLPHLESFPETRTQSGCSFHELLIHLRVVDLQALQTSSIVVVAAVVVVGQHWHCP